MKKNIIVAILAITLLSGCAIKKTDNLGIKTLKHTARSPLYLIAGVNLLVIGTLGLTAKAIVETKNAIIGKEKEKIVKK